MDLADKVVVITGASRGIGAAAARAFADAGAKVALVARSEAAIATLAQDIGSNAIALPASSTRPFQDQALRQVTSWTDEKTA